ncbi:hypothetical protein [Veronia nyctiphanis]|uniref:hypothetical protein n=1 Tax=Veronia nyctiphanis TaxID=1278244 RepID=UPI001F486724|nr:hypothetical protein [Veronia nyctiphanis]
MKKTALILALALAAFQPVANACSDHESAPAEAQTYQEVQTFNNALTVEGARAKARFPV